MRLDVDDIQWGTVQTSTPFEIRMDAPEIISPVEGQDVSRTQLEGLRIDWDGISFSEGSLNRHYEVTFTLPAVLSNEDVLTTPAQSVVQFTANEDITEYSFPLAEFDQEVLNTGEDIGVIVGVKAVERRSGSPFFG